MGEVHALGEQGELWALRYLEERGCRLLRRNYRSRFGEVDLIVWDGDVLVFVEVRTLRGHSPERALASVDARKQQRLIKTAQTFLVEEMPDTLASLRFDVVGVRWQETTELRWLRGAFVC